MLLGIYWYTQVLLKSTFPSLNSQGIHMCMWCSVRSNYLCLSVFVLLSLGVATCMHMLSTSLSFLYIYTVDIYIDIYIYINISIDII